MLARHDEVPDTGVLAKLLVLYPVADYESQGLI